MSLQKFRCCDIGGLDIEGPDIGGIFKKDGSFFVQKPRLGDIGYLATLKDYPIIQVNCCKQLYERNTVKDTHKECYKGSVNLNNMYFI